MERDFLAEKSGPMSLAQRRGMVERVHPSSSIARQRVLLGVSRLLA